MFSLQLTKYFVIVLAVHKTSTRVLWGEESHRRVDLVTYPLIRGSNKAHVGFQRYKRSSSVSKLYCRHILGAVNKFVMNEPRSLLSKYRAVCGLAERLSR